MKGLKNINVIQAINEFILSGKQVLGICLGMQLMLENSYENGFHCGMGLIPGSVKKIHQKDENGTRKTPHIGWSALQNITRNDKTWEKTILRNTKLGEFVYFVHTFMAMPKSSKNIIAHSEYIGLNIIAAVKKDNITGLQFHPENSGKVGLKILSEFVNGVF